MTKEDLSKIAINKNIRPLFQVYKVDEIDLVYHIPKVLDEHDSIGLEVSKREFYRRLGLPILPLLKKLLKFTRIALGKLDLNTFIHINAFQYQCPRAKVNPRLSLLLHHYDFKKNVKSAGFYQLARRSGRVGWAATNSSNKGTHDH